MLDKIVYFVQVNNNWIVMNQISKTIKRFPPQVFAKIENIAEKVENQHEEYYYLNPSLVRFDSSRSIYFHRV